MASYLYIKKKYDELSEQALDSMKELYGEFQALHVGSISLYIWLSSHYNHDTLNTTSSQSM